jgi:hypothetical protein
MNQTGIFFEGSGCPSPFVKGQHYTRKDLRRIDPAIFKTEGTIARWDKEGRGITQTPINGHIYYKGEDVIAFLAAPRGKKNTVSHLRNKQLEKARASRAIQRRAVSAGGDS